MTPNCIKTTKNDLKIKNNFKMLKKMTKNVQKCKIKLEYFASKEHE